MMGTEHLAKALIAILSRLFLCVVRCVIFQHFKDVLHGLLCRKSITVPCCADFCSVSCVFDVEDVVKIDHERHFAVIVPPHCEYEKFVVHSVAPLLELRLVVLIHLLIRTDDDFKRYADSVYKMPVK